ncbi:MAG: hypothetical protein JNK72_08975 [Myxococcales bacterium]|jgi:hypothetical protein|nr:hypothetical protein [Myxococcales bacterium]
MIKLPTMATMLAVVATVAGCGSDGLTVEGRVDLTVRQAGQADGVAAFAFPQSTVVDAPPGIGRGIFGRCERVDGAWLIELDRADNAGDALQRISLRIADAGSAHTASFALGTSSFSASGACTAAANTVGTSLRATMQCTGLRATGDARSVDAVVNLTFQNCTGQ